MIGDTNILDLDTSVFEKSDEVIEEGVEKKESQIKPLLEDGSEKILIPTLIKKNIKINQLLLRMKSITLFLLVL